MKLFSLNENESFNDALLEKMFHPQSRLIHCSSHCYGYHQGWILLQSLGLISGLSIERESIVLQLKEEKKAHLIRSVLIVGAADSGLLSIVHEAFADETTFLDITVLDLCPTPLTINKEYAQWMGFSIKTMCENFLESFDTKQYDLILSHSILSFIPENKRSLFIAGYSKSLAQGGSVLVYQSIRPDCDVTVLKFEESQIMEWKSLAKKTLSQKHERFKWLNETLLELIVSEFCHTKKTFPVYSEEEVLGYFTDSKMKAIAINVLSSEEKIEHKAATPTSQYDKYLFRIEKV